MPYDHTIAAFDLSFEPNHAAASTARQEARVALDEAGVPHDVASDVELIIAELASNAVDQNPEVAVILRVEITPETIVIHVRNQTIGDQPMPSIDAAVGRDLLIVSGRGLGIVATLGDEVGVTSDENWTSVSVRYRI